MIFFILQCIIIYSSSSLSSVSAPLSVTNAALSNQSVAEIVASWLPPSDRNGSFNITINYTAAQVFRYENRIQTDSREMELFGSSTQTTRNETISEVLPYALYTVTITAFNRLFGRSLSSSPVTVTTISQPTGKSYCTCTFTYHTCTCTCKSSTRSPLEMSYLQIVLQFAQGIF